MCNMLNPTMLRYVALKCCERYGHSLCRHNSKCFYVLSRERHCGVLLPIFVSLQRFIDDIFAIWCGPKGVLLEFLSALNNKADRINKVDRIKLPYSISEISIYFLDLFLYRHANSSKLQFSTP